MEVPYDELDPGICELVRWLNDNGFETVDSGDGKTKFEDGNPLPEWESGDHRFDVVIPHPHVAMRVPVTDLGLECDRLRDLLVARGVEVEVMGPDGGEITVQGSYDPVEGGAYVMLMGLLDFAA